MKKIIRNLGFAVVIGTLAAAAFTGIVSADPPIGGNAGCMGYEAADDSPPGSLTGATNQYGMPGVMNIAIDGAVEAGIVDTRGEFITFIAHNSGLGSHQACDEALGLDPGTE